MGVQQIRRTTCCKLLCMLALVMASLPTSSAASHRHRHRHRRTLKYYVPAIEDSSTAHIVLPVDAEATGTFGQLAVFSYKVTQQPSINSTQVGSIRGLEVYDGMNTSAPSILVLNTLTYNDGVYAGTISLHGQGNIALTTYEITVVGGTADFRGVAGYAAITNLRTPGSDHVFQHVLHLDRRL